jgi:TonB family protein
MPATRNRIERRTRERVSVLEHLGLIIVANAGTGTGLILDLGEDGMSVQLAGSMPMLPEWEVQFALDYGATPVKAKARTVWRKDGVLGMRFVDFEAQCRDRLSRWLSERYDGRRLEPISSGQSLAPTADEEASEIAPQPPQDFVDNVICESHGSANPANAGNKETSPTVEPPRADRRARRRSLIAVPMLARWRDNRDHEVKINSRDMSDGGIFFHVNSDVAIGTEVELIFTLPSDPGAIGNRRLRVQGTVIRAEREADRIGYALRVTSSELLAIEDTVAQARQALRGLAANDSSSNSPPQALRVSLLFLACSGLVGLIIGLGMFVAGHEGGAANAAATVREMIARIRSNLENAPPPDVQQRRVERARTGGAAGTRERRRSSSHAGHEAAEPSPDTSAAQQFDNNNVLTLDLQKGKLVSLLGERKALATRSFTSTAAPTGDAITTPNSAAVVLRVIVRRDGGVEAVRRTSGSVKLAPAAIAAIRHWKFQPDHSDEGPMQRQIYVTVNFTISKD